MKLIALTAAATLLTLPAPARPGACGSFPYCATSPNSAGAGAIIGSDGGMTVSNNDTILTVTGAPPSVNGIFFYGLNATSSPFGDGIRCIGGQIFRLPIATTDANGNLNYNLDVNSAPVGGEFQPFSFWRFQFWYRDTSGPGGSGFNLSNGMQLFFCG